VARLVPQVHADLADVFEVVERLLELRQLGVGQIEGDPMIGSSDGHPHSSVR
jgi:hypothetical protein